MLAEPTSHFGLASNLPPKKEWANHPEFTEGQTIHVLPKPHLKPKYHLALGIVRKYHPTSGVYTVYLEKFGVEVTLHKTEMRCQIVPSKWF
jgi:hypothetical protein